jgi:Na+-translocating ferredoxin:NAD+ oxidoreductase RnfC subunit
MIVSRRADEAASLRQLLRARQAPLTAEAQTLKFTTQNPFRSQDTEAALRSDLRIAAANSEAAAAAAAAEKQDLLAQIGESTAAMTAAAAAAAASFKSSFPITSPQIADVRHAAERLCDENKKMKPMEEMLQQMMLDMESAHQRVDLANERVLTSANASGR